MRASPLMQAPFFNDGEGGTTILFKRMAAPSAPAVTVTTLHRRDVLFERPDGQGRGRDLRQMADVELRGQQGQGLEIDISAGGNLPQNRAAEEHHPRGCAVVVPGQAGVAAAGRQLRRQFRQRP